MHQSCVCVYVCVWIYQCGSSSDLLLHEPTAVAVGLQLENNWCGILVRGR